VLRPKTGVTVVVVLGDQPVASWRLGSSRPPGLELVDELARLQVAARRLDCSIRLRGHRAELVELFELVGLRDALPEMLGQPERGEESGIDEVVVPDDPLA
jgi:hypothetical protein